LRATFFSASQLQDFTGFDARFLFRWLALERPALQQSTSGLPVHDDNTLKMHR
jgi:hypothetical protein